MNKLTIAAILAACLLISNMALAKPPAKPAARPAAGKAAPKQQNGTLSAAYTAYVNRLRSKLDGKWYLADGKNRVVLSAQLDPNGSVTGLKMTSSPSNVQAEQAASDAFNQCQPLEALPAGSQPVQLTLTFESTADPHGDNNRSIGAEITVQPQSPPATGDSK